MVSISFPIHIVFVQFQFVIYGPFLKCASDVYWNLTVNIAFEIRYGLKFASLIVIFAGCSCAPILALQFPLCSLHSDIISQKYRSIDNQ